MEIKQAVILAAGLGTRFFPITKSISKEMLPLVDKPCIQHLVEELILSGIKKIIIVINKDEVAIKNHFGSPNYLYEQLKKKKKTQELKLLKSIGHGAQINFVTQANPHGDGHAILCVKHLLDNEPFAVLFGDDIYDSKIPATKQLIAQYKKYKAPIIALAKIDKKDSDKYGMIKIESKKGTVYKISDFVEKPTAEKSPSNLAITGKYIITKELLKTLAQSNSNSTDKELRLIDGMKKFIKNSSIYGFEVKGKRFDTGSKSGYLKAVLHFARKRHLL